MNHISFFNESKEITGLDTVTQMLAIQAAVRPLETAIEWRDQRLTFRDLEQTAQRLANGIANAQPKNGSTIGLFCEPSADMIIGIWGILFSGNAYLPLAPEYPEDRLRYTIENSDTKVILTQSHLVETITEIAPNDTVVICIEEVGASMEMDATESLEPGPESLAYVIFTSGSTGRPKGVMIEHRNIVSQMQWIAREGFLRPGDRILQKTPMSFDAAQWEILAPAVGATVVAGEVGLYRDPEMLVEKIKLHDVSVLQCVPTLLQALTDQTSFAQCATLHSVFSGGEALSRKLAKAFTMVLPECTLVNLYGPTECTINATAHRVDNSDIEQEGGSISIGTAVDGTNCYLFDETMKLVADGEEGELYIGGAQVGRGYMNNPEQTSKVFVQSPAEPDERLYRTGDICTRNGDGSLQFSGRVDSQVKLRGYRVELEEISLAIEQHVWVKHATTVITEDPRSGAQILDACVELNEKEAALMDQGTAGNHHRSKSNKLQVKAQLSNPGCRTEEQDANKKILSLPGKEETKSQRRKVFARKTYRFYKGDTVSKCDVEKLIETATASALKAAEPESITVETLGDVMRWMGRFESDERLLPKYAYASPGALYATQLYLECKDIPGVADGVHYFHPTKHALVGVSDRNTLGKSGLRFHFVGKNSAIEPVYKNNILEVLEMETGHMLGVLDVALRDVGYGLSPAGADVADLESFDAAKDDYYLGSFDCMPEGKSWQPDVEVYVQPQGEGVEGLDTGTYRVSSDGLQLVSEQVVRRNHVIAINQRVFDRASMGISLVCRQENDWLKYISLGYAMHKFQDNASGFGFMSSGYSSKTGNPLPAAVRLDEILGHDREAGFASYFFVGGRLSEEQVESQGMLEDVVHMQGPAELIKEELGRTLPDYMIPNRVHIFEKLPQTANGKVDRKAVAASDQLQQANSSEEYKPPQGATENWLAEVWAKALKYELVSRNDDFFASGGNSLIAIATLNEINKVYGLNLPAQTLFEHPTLQDLAKCIDAGSNTKTSRFINLNKSESGRPIYCWPGLGGYPMNLRNIACSNVEQRPFYGIQSQGINGGEKPFETIGMMAAGDIKEIVQLQPEGPITLWGYSFGARVAFETAWQLEKMGRTVDQLVLICPGNPQVESDEVKPLGREASFSCKTYVAILLSVFTGHIDMDLANSCMENCDSHDEFVNFVNEHRPELSVDVIRRISTIVGKTYEFDYNFKELTERQISAPVTIIKAQGDDYSFIERADNYAESAPNVVEAETDHYSILTSDESDNLAQMIDSATTMRPAPQDFRDDYAIAKVA